MATDTAPATLREDFVTRRLLLLALLIFAINAPTLTAWGTLTAQVGAALLYLAVALAMAVVAKALIVVSRHGLGGLTE